MNTRNFACQWEGSIGATFGLIDEEVSMYFGGGLRWYPVRGAAHETAYIAGSEAIVLNTGSAAPYIGIDLQQYGVISLFNYEAEFEYRFGACNLSDLLPVINAPALGLASVTDYETLYESDRCSTDDQVELTVSMMRGDLLDGIGSIPSNTWASEGTIISQVSPVGVSKLVFTKVDDTPKLLFCTNEKHKTYESITPDHYREVATIGAGTVFTGTEQIKWNDYTAVLGDLAQFNASNYLHLFNRGKVENTATLYKSNSNTFGLLDPTVCISTTGDVGVQSIKTVSALYNSQNIAANGTPTDLITFADSLLRTEYVLNGPENPWYSEQYSGITDTGSTWSAIISDKLRDSDSGFKAQTKELTDYQQSLLSLRVLARALSITPKTEAFVKTDEVTADTDFSTHKYYKYVESNSSETNDWGYTYATEYDSKETYYIKDISRLTLANIDLAKLMMATDSNKPSDKFYLYCYMCNWLGQRLLALLNSNVTLKVAVGGNNFRKYPTDYKYAPQYSDNMSATTYLSCSRYQIIQLPDTQEVRNNSDKTKLNLSNNVLVMYFDYRPSELMLPLYGIQESFNRLTDYDPADNAVFGDLIEQSLDNSMDTVKTMALYIRLYNDNTLDD